MRACLAAARWGGGAVIVLRVLLGVAGVAMLGAMVWAAFASPELHGGFFTQAQVFLVLPWGRALLADTLLGYALIALLMALSERSWALAIIWIAPLLLLGHAWTAIWLAVRLPALASRLTRPDWPGA